MFSTIRKSKNNAVQEKHKCSEPYGNQTYSVPEGEHKCTRRKQTSLALYLRKWDWNSPVQASQDEQHCTRHVQVLCSLEIHRHNNQDIGCIVKLCWMSEFFILINSISSSSISSKNEIKEDLGSQQHKTLTASLVWIIMTWLVNTQAMTSQYNSLRIQPLCTHCHRHPG